MLFKNLDESNLKPNKMWVDKDITIDHEIIARKNAPEIYNERKICCCEDLLKP